MKPEHVIIILNNGSGLEDGPERKAKIADRFKHHGIPASFVTFDPGADLEKTARDTAAKSPNSTIVASGGDGTISGVAAGLAGLPNQFGIIASGTINYFARS